MMPVFILPPGDADLIGLQWGLNTDMTRGSPHVSGVQPRLELL